MSIATPPTLSKTTPRQQASSLFAGFRVVSLFTFASRVLGLVRDVGMATLFGNGMVMDAFSIAFRVPNLARRLFGEGALSTAFLPVFIRELEQSGRSAAWELASSVLAVLALLLGAIVVIGELLLWSLSTYGNFSAEAELLIGLTAVLLPYLMLICLAAQVGAVLHGLGHFAWPALLPILLNVVWIAAIWLIAPQLGTSTMQAYAVSLCIVAAGILQLVAPLPTLHRLGFRFSLAWQSVRGKVVSIARTMLPIIIGLSITQLNTLADSLIAWSFSQPVLTEEAASLTAVTAGLYPLESGTVSALYFGQRMYQFPLGVFGVALGTVLFPLLSRHAERGRLDLLRDDLSMGIKLVIVIGLPASAGLFLLARPLTALLFQHGAFDVHDAIQTTAMIRAYGIGVWAYCGLLILHRGFYAIGDQLTPLRIGVVAMILNLVLNFTLIWPLGGQGLAIATAITAIIQVIAIACLLHYKVGRIDWPAIGRTTLKAIAAVAVMSAVCLIVASYADVRTDIFGRLLAVLLPLVAAIITYFTAAKLLGLNELWLLFKRENQHQDPDEIVE